MRIGQELIASMDFRVDKGDSRTLTKGHVYTISSIDNKYYQFAVRADNGSEIYFDNDEIDIYFD